MHGDSENIMGSHMYDASEEEVIYDQTQFGLLNQTEDDGSSFSSKTKSLYWTKLFKTITLCAAYFSLGLCMSVTGPTLPFLQEQVGSSISQVSYIFTARSVGVLSGSFFGGFLMERYNPYSLLFMVIASMAIGVGAMPWCRHLWMLMLSSALIGIGGGFLDTGASTLCLELWGQGSGPYMQALHFTFALGGSVAPLMVQAFIVDMVSSNGTSSSHRHVRSASDFPNSTRNPDNLLTDTILADTNLTAIMHAITEASVVEMPTNPKDTVTAITPSSVTLKSNLLSTTASLIGFQQTATNSSSEPIKRPKKPKPEITNGESFGDSRQFESIPLVNDPKVHKEIVLTTSSTTEAVAVTTTINPMISVNSTSNSSNSSKISEHSSIPIESKASEKVSTINSTLINPAGSATAVQTTTLKPVISGITNPNSTQFVIASIPSDSIKSSTSATSTAEPTEVTSKAATIGPTPNVTSVPNVTTSVIPKTTSTTKITTPTIATSTSATTRKTSPSSSIPTTMSSTTVVQTPSTIKAEPIDVGKSSGVENWSEISMEMDPSATKSRGKYRGQGATTEATLFPAGSDESDDVSGGVVMAFEKYGVTRMHMLYTVIAIIVLHVAFSFLFFLCSTTLHPRTIQSAERKVHLNRPRQKYLFVGLLFFFYLSYVGSEVSYGQFLATFALNGPLKLSPSTANYVTTTFWASFAATRFVSIFIAHFFNPTSMLVLNLVLCSVGSISLCVGAQSNLLVLYVGSAILGTAMASTFATGFLWTEARLTVTHRIASMFSIASALGEMIFPTITGVLMDSHPMALMYLIVSSNVLCIATFAGAWFLTSRWRNGPAFSRSLDTSTYQTPRLTDE